MEKKKSVFTVWKCSQLEPIYGPAFHLFASAGMNQTAPAWNDNTIFQALFMAWWNNVITFCDRLRTDSTAFDTLATVRLLSTLFQFLWLGVLIANERLLDGS